MTPEKQIQNTILSWLSFQKNCFVWQADSVGIFDPVKKTFRMNRSRHRVKGVADILGIYHGRPIAIEVKTKTGKLSSEQKLFLEKFNLFGGIGFVARSLEDVKSKLEEALKNK